MLNGLSVTDQIFFFDELLTDDLYLDFINPSSKNECNVEHLPEISALGYIKSIANSFNGGIYLVIADEAGGARTALRSKKGVLWKAKKLRELKGYNFEIDLDNGGTRLVSIVDLKEFKFDACEDFILNWTRSFLILSHLKLDAFKTHVETWVDRGEDSYSSFNYWNVVKSILKLGSCGVLRYFPESNGRDETVILAADKKYNEYDFFQSIRI